MANNALGLNFKDKRAMDDAILSGSDRNQTVYWFYRQGTHHCQRCIAQLLSASFQGEMDAVPGLPTYFIFKPTNHAQMCQN